MFVDVRSVTNSLSCNFICSHFYPTDSSEKKAPFFFFNHCLDSVPPSITTIYEVKLIFFVELQVDLDILPLSYIEYIGIYLEIYVDSSTINYILL